MRRRTMASILERVAGRAATRDPRTSYFICATPRSGTTLLATMLAASKRVGYANEHFAQENEPSWAPSDYKAFVAHVVASRSARGVFGAKLFWNHLQRLLTQLRQLSAEDGLADPAVLEGVFPNPRYIWLRRSDAVEQAVSWSKAAQLGEFYAGDPRRTGVVPIFDFDEIHRLVGELRDADGLWSRWFARHGVQPHPIVYEQLAADPAAVVAATLRFLDIPVPRRTIAATTVRMADGLNKTWVERYRELAACRAMT